MNKKVKKKYESTFHDETPTFGMKTKWTIMQILFIEYNNFIVERQREKRPKMYKVNVLLIHE